MTGRRRGFTLVELLIVIAILGILAGILLPVLAIVMEKAKKGTCKAEIESLGTALAAYRDDWGVFPPDAGPGPSRTALVVYLDGDASNGGPSTIYFSFAFDRIGPAAAGLAANEYANPWGLAYVYDELESERAARGDPAGDPRTNKVRVHTFDLYAEHPDDPPAEWITNYRD